MEPVSPTTSPAAPEPRRRFTLVDVAGPVAIFGLFVGFWYLAHYVLMSDNRCSMHRASEWDEDSYVRRLHRIIMIDDKAPY